MTGICECGCGQPAPIAMRTDTARGTVKGQPQRFINHHRSRLPIPARDDANRSRTRPLAERFAAKYVEAENGCWLWTGALGSDGYGNMVVAGRTIGAHRIAYELHVGEIPEGCEIHHTCETPLCVNPAHLIAVTRATHRALEWQPLCSRGHTRYRAPGGRWVCAICQAAASRRYYQKRKRVVA